MDPERAVPEIGRVLRDGGRFAVIWTGRDREAGWVRDIERLREPGQPARQAADEHGAQGEGGRRTGHREVSLPDDAMFGHVQTCLLYTSSPGEPNIVTPPWALERAAEIGAGMARSISCLLYTSRCV